MRRFWATAILSVRSKQLGAYAHSVEAGGKALAIEAVSEAEAIGLAMQASLETYPKADGWENHQVSVVEIPRKWFEEDK